MNKSLLPSLIIILFAFNTYCQDTFSIVAVDPETGEVGSAGASCVDLTAFPGFSDDFLGELFPGLGAINTQAWYNQSNQTNARSLMNSGFTPSQIIDSLIDNDISGQPELRQYGIVALVNGSPESAAHTGSFTDDYKNHITGPNYSIQGNILLGQEILDSMESRFLEEPGDLACKLMAALQGANVIGADSRCSSNGTSSLFAFLKIAQPNDTFGSPFFIQSVRTKDGDGVEPIDSLQLLFNQEHNCVMVGTNENIDANFSIFPNPIADVLAIKSKNNQNYKIEILDVTGRIIHRTSFYNILEFNASSIKSGIYFVKISNDRMVSIKKVIKG